MTECHRECQWSYLDKTKKYEQNIILYAEKASKRMWPPSPAEGIVQSRNIFPSSINCSKLFTKKNVFFLLIKAQHEFSLWADGCKNTKVKIWNSRWCVQTHKSYDIFFWLDKQTTTLKFRAPLQIAAFCEIHLLLKFFNSCLKLAVHENTPASKIIN